MPVILFLQGFYKDTGYKRARELLLDFPIIELTGKDIAIESTENYRYILKNGQTIKKTIDVLIETSCIHHGLTLLHNDKDFTPFEKHLQLMRVKI